MGFINQLLIDFPIQTSYLQSPFSRGRDHIPTTGTAVETMCMFFFGWTTPRQKKKTIYSICLYVQYGYPKSMGLSFKNIWETMVFTCFTINLSGFNINLIMCQNLWFSPSWWAMDIQKDKLFKYVRKWKPGCQRFGPIAVYNIITISQWLTVDGYQIIAYFFLSPRYVLKSKSVAETRPLSEVNVIGPGSSPPRSHDYSGFWVLGDPEFLRPKMPSQSIL